MLKQIHPQIEVAKSGTNRSNTIYIFKHPRTQHPIERIPNTAILLIGPVRPALVELIQAHSRHHFQKNILPLSANAHHKLQTALVEHQPGEFAQLQAYGDDFLTLASTGSGSSSRIDLLFGREHPARWEQALPANVILVGTDNGRLKQTLLEQGQELRQALSLSVKTYTRLREYLGIKSPVGRPKKSKEKES